MAFYSHTQNSRCNTFYACVIQMCTLTSNESGFSLSGGNEKIISVGERCLLGANSGIGISLGNDCTVEAGLYLTAGTKVTLVDNEEKIVKALELSGKDGILYYRDSLSGKVCAKVNNTQFKLNKALHENN